METVTIKPDIPHICGDCTRLFTVSAPVEAIPDGQNEVTFSNNGRSVTVTCDQYLLSRSFVCPHCGSVLHKFKDPVDDLESQLVAAGVL